jgi:hypothetical protein
MKQSKNSAAAFDLDDLERELQQAIAPRKPAAGDDPLAELARIVGQDQGVRGVNQPRGSFADFIAQPPQPAAGPAPVVPPPITPLYPDNLRPNGDFAPLRAANETAPAPKVVDPLEALLAQDLGLRSGLDELPEPKPIEKSADPLASLDALISGETKADSHLLAPSDRA